MRFAERLRICRELAMRGLRRRTWFRVRGASMAPGLAPGDLVLVRPPRAGLPPVGATVLVRSPEDRARVLIKRVASCGAASFSVASDDPNVGRDSRHFGSLSSENWLGTATLVFSACGALAPLAASLPRE